MNSLPYGDAPPPPSPSTCPTCGDVALSDGVSVDRGIATNHCTDRHGHIWIVRWMVSA